MVDIRQGYMGKPRCHSLVQNVDVIGFEKMNHFHIKGKQSYPHGHYTFTLFKCLYLLGKSISLFSKANEEDLLVHIRHIFCSYTSSSPLLEIL